MAAWLSNLLGFISVCVWVIAQLPQMIKNYKRKKADPTLTHPITHDRMVGMMPRI